MKVDRWRKDCEANSKLQKYGRLEIALSVSTVTHNVPVSFQARVGNEANPSYSLTKQSSCNKSYVTDTVCSACVYLCSTPVLLSVSLFLRVPVVCTTHVLTGYSLGRDSGCSMPGRPGSRSLLTAGMSSRPVTLPTFIPQPSKENRACLKLVEVVALYICVLHIDFDRVRLLTLIYLLLDLSDLPELTELLIGKKLE